MNLQTSPCSVTSPPPLPFACEPESGRAVRRYVRSRVIDGGLATHADEAETVIAELFANAVQAQQRQRVTTVISVQAIAAGYAVVLEVYDHAEGGPFLRDLGPDWLTAEHGRGMHMVHRVSTAAGDGNAGLQARSSPLSSHNHSPLQAPALRLPPETPARKPQPT